VELGRILPLVAEQQLSPDSIEVIGAAEDVQPIVVSLEVAPHLDLALSADLAVQENHGMASQGATARLPALSSVSTNPVVAVIRVIEPVPEPERVLSDWVFGDRLRNHAEVMIERSKGRCGERGGAEGRQGSGEDELAQWDASCSD
jgi:hypothetical protein